MITWVTVPLVMILIVGSYQQTVNPRYKGRNGGGIIRKPRGLGDCWTDWFDRDNPGGTGDWETLSELRKERPGKICVNPLQIEVQTTAGQSVASTGNVIHKADTATGFVCRNSDQKRGMCRDYRVRFMCPPSFCAAQGCWTDWFDRDNPSGTGDWEMLNSLRKERPGKICANPLQIQVQTTAGQTVASTGNVIYKIDTVTGFVCKNSDQKRGMCRDYRVRFLCPPAFCNPGGNTPAPTTLLSTPSLSTAGCWTDWFDRDNPRGTGDWEMLNSLKKERPVKVCANPLQIQVQTTAEQTVASTGNVIYKIDTVTGFACRNSDQKRGMCRDYRVRYLCPPAFCNPGGNTPAPTTFLSTPSSSIPGCWTDWFDRDNPCDTGDWETLNSLRRERPGKICDSPLQIEVQTTAGQTVASTGNVIYKSSPTEGFVCRNKDQKRGLCQDYKVRFGCPCQYNKTERCSAGNPTVFLFLSLYVLGWVEL